eukprot:7389128-Prymnesium_polylepis.1
MSARVLRMTADSKRKCWPMSWSRTARARGGRRSVASLTPSWTRRCASSARKARGCAAGKVRGGGKGDGAVGRAVLRPLQGVLRRGQAGAGGEEAAAGGGATASDRRRRRRRDERRLQRRRGRAGEHAG